MPGTSMVFVHAHPDDEALLTAGTMARASAEGHRVTLIVATDGSAGLTSTGFSHDLASTRAYELALSARALGVARVVHLGYRDSGLLGDASDGFAHASPDDVGRSIAEVAEEERATVLVGYDPAGGYGHPDHLQVHRATRVASHLYSQPHTVFEATLPREPIAKAVAWAARLRLTPQDFDPAEFAQAWTPRTEITHRIDVGPHMQAKIASLRAHASQASADGTVRTLAVLTRLPAPVRRVLLGTEYYVRVPASDQRSTV
jgi:LmbE family N-acetylglucosaminyl deacetylase